MADEPELITIGEARARLGVSKVTMARLVKEGRFTLYENALDRREKLVDAAEVAAVAKPRQVRPKGDAGPAGKGGA